MKKSKPEIKKELTNLSELIIDSRQLLSTLQKIEIESERSRGWMFGDLFGAWTFTKQAKHRSQGEIKNLVKDAQRKCRRIKKHYEASRLEFKLSSLNYFVDYFLSFPLATLIQLRKVNTLKKDVKRFSVELENEIRLMEQQEERLIVELKNLVD